ncbi:MAG: hypothetical protein BBJ60_10440 [Desulfobacterales bacterium S7086C20]|nr:MAG: hypothetical protein BBJ60_10440 [Desulfobacterales bacterium S7086C20]
MEEPTKFEEQKRAISRFTSVFLKEHFSFSVQSISLLMDNQMVVIRVDDFLSPAEIEMGLEREKRRLIDDAYSREFDAIKSSLVDRISEITGKRILTCRFGMIYKTRTCMMTFFLSSK